MGEWLQCKTRLIFGSKTCLQIPKDLLRRFSILKKCRNKFDSLVNEMLFIRDLKPTDSERAKRLYSRKSISLISLKHYMLIY